MKVHLHAAATTLHNGKVIQHVEYHTDKRVAGDVDAPIEIRDDADLLEVLYDYIDFCAHDCKIPPLYWNATMYDMDGEVLKQFKVWDVDKCATCGKPFDAREKHCKENPYMCCGCHWREYNNKNIKKLDDVQLAGKLQDIFTMPARGENGKTFKH